MKHKHMPTQSVGSENQMDIFSCQCVLCIRFQPYTFSNEYVAKYTLCGLG